MAAPDPSSPSSNASTRASKRLLRASAALSLLLLASCAATIPPGVIVAKNFDPLRFEGTWYELARTNHPDEGGLTRVTSTYIRKSDGTWLVTDRAWSNADGAWVGSERAAKPGEFPASLRLKHAKPRNIVLIDSEHTMALVCSNTYKQFWIISKNPDPEPARFDKMLSAAQEAGFPVKEAMVLPTR